MLNDRICTVFQNERIANFHLDFFWPAGRVAARDERNPPLISPCQSRWQNPCGGNLWNETDYCPSGQRPDFHSGNSPVRAMGESPMRASSPTPQGAGNQENGPDKFTLSEQGGVHDQYIPLGGACGMAGLPEGVEAATGVETTQSRDGVGTFLGPEHAGLLFAKNVFPWLVRMRGDGVKAEKLKKEKTGPVVRLDSWADLLNPHKSCQSRPECVTLNPQECYLCSDPKVLPMF